MAAARRKTGSRAGSRPSEAAPGDNVGGSVPGDTTPAPGTTGRYLVLMDVNEVQHGVEMLSDTLGVEVLRSADYDNQAVDAETLQEADAIVFDNLAVAVVNAPPEQFGALSAAAATDSGILAIEPERIVYAISDLPVDLNMPVLEDDQPNLTDPTLLQYLLGYRDAVNQLVARFVPASAEATLTRTPGAAAFDEANLTWGLQATRVSESRFTGRGVRVAVLDTGMDLQHPDFVGRTIVSRSFVQGEAVQDGHGHGTHCIGTACGSRQPSRLPRYGIATEAEIYAGKVLSNAGSGGDSGILAGIAWAIQNKCAVISMSLGAPTSVGQSYSRVYETVARRALAAGSLIVAAAGNESRRPGRIDPVSHPANCPSIISVAAVDSAFQIAPFSCGGRNPNGGQVDLAGPGVNVYSSLPRPRLNGRLNGTSMATPHVAGIAALFAEANPDVRGGALGWLLLQSARRLPLPTSDVGAGLVQAP